jgi:hypothetical protein
MDIDQRLDKLTERHEALTQTVELIARMQIKTEEAQQSLVEAQQRTAEAQRKNEVLIAQVMESVNGLARIAHLHEQRITDIEDRRQ